MVGRPRKESQLDESQVERLASIGCSDHEIATLAGISETQLKANFRPLLNKGRAALRENLRAVQIKKAIGVPVVKTDKDGNEQIYTTPPDSTMLIWLGKQYLGQSDKAEVRDTTNDIDWDSVPDDLNDDFADGKITLDELRRKLRKRSAG